MRDAPRYTITDPVAGWAIEADTAEEAAAAIYEMLYRSGADGLSEKPANEAPTNKNARWRAKMRAEGRCTRCGKTCAPRRQCLECRDKRNVLADKYRTEPRKYRCSICGSLEHTKPRCDELAKWSERHGDVEDD